jgi:nitrogen regulatory protein PII
MMLITAVVAPNRIDAIWRTLRLFDVTGMTVCAVILAGRHRRRVDVATTNADTPDLVRILSRLAAPGDLIRVTRLDHFVAIRTGESGPGAL